jgi:hypothetical protein
MSDLSKLPFIQEGTLAANEETELNVKDDPVYGLMEPGGTGYIQNDGPGSITIQTTDNYDGLSKESTIKINEQLVFEESDDIEICVVRIIADASGASYRTRFARVRQ